MLCIKQTLADFAHYFKNIDITNTHTHTDTEMTQKWHSPAWSPHVGLTHHVDARKKPYYTEEVQALGVMNETFVSWGEAWVAMCGICLV